MSNWEREVSQLLTAGALPAVMPPEPFTNPDDAEDYDCGPDAATQLGARDKPWPMVYGSLQGGGILASGESHLIGGSLIVGHGEGQLAVAAASADASMDFGQAMTVGDFVLLQRAGFTEYVEVGALSVGTVYAVTRDLATTDAQDWPASTPFLVLGAEDDGRIEHDATASPRMAIKLQGATYDAYTEPVRIGDLNGWGAYVAEVYGIALGDYAGGNYLTYDPTNGFVIHCAGNFTALDETGMTLAFDDTEWTNGSVIRWRSTDATPLAAADLGTYLKAGVPNPTLTTELLVNKDADYTLGQLVIGAYQGDTSYSGMTFYTGRAEIKADVVYAKSPAFWTDSLIFIGDDANAKMTKGLTINQGAADDEAVALKSSDVAHGCTDVAETDTYGNLSKVAAASGGLLVRGLTEGYVGAELRGIATTASNARSTSAAGAVILDGRLVSGAGVASLGADKNIAVIRDNGTTRFIFDTDGSAHADVEWTTFDEHDDIALITDMERALKAEFSNFLRYNRADLEALDLAHFDRDNPGHAMVNTTRLSMLLCGALRQVSDRLAAVEAKLLTA